MKLDSLVQMVCNMSISGASIQTEDMECVLESIYGCTEMSEVSTHGAAAIVLATMESCDSLTNQYALASLAGCLLKELCLLRLQRAVEVLREERHAASASAAASRGH